MARCYSADEAPVKGMCWSSCQSLCSLPHRKGRSTTHSTVALDGIAVAGARGERHVADVGRRLADIELAELEENRLARSSLMSASHTAAVTATN